MWCFIFYSPWSFEKVEQKLEKMETEGLRLAKVRFYFWFYFVKAKPKYSHYVLTYNYYNETVMFECEEILKAEYNADPIDGGKTFYTSIFRVTNLECDLTEIKAFRQQYLRAVCVKKMLISLLFFVPGLAASIYAQIHDSTIGGEGIAVLVVAIIGFIGLLYYLYGIWSFSRKHIK